MGFSATTSATIRAVQTKTVGLGVPNNTVERVVRMGLAGGTGADEADVLYHAADAIGTETTTTLNLANGSLQDGLGDDVEMDRIKVAYVRNTGTVPLLLRGANGIVPTGSITIMPGQIYLNATGDEDAHPTDGAATIIVENESTTDAGAYEMIIIGASE